MPPLAADTTLLFTLTDTDGLQSREPVRLMLVPTPDQPPQMSVQLDGIGTAITPQARVAVAGGISDDYGIGRVWFERAIDQQAQAVMDSKAGFLRELLGTPDADLEKVMKSRLTELDDFFFEVLTQNLQRAQQSDPQVFAQLQKIGEAAMRVHPDTASRPPTSSSNRGSTTRGSACRDRNSTPRRANRWGNRPSGPRPSTTPSSLRMCRSFTSPISAPRPKIPTSL